MVLYAYTCVFVHSCFIENPLIWSWETNPSFLRWFCHKCPHGPCSAPARTDSTGSHCTRGAPCSRSSATRPGAGWQTRGGATHHNETIRQLQGWRRGSHLSVENKGEMNQHFINWTETTNQNSKLHHYDVKALTQILFSTDTNSQNSADWDWYKIRESAQYESDREFWDLSRKYKYTLIRPTVQELWSLKVGGGVSSSQTELSEQIWTLSLLPNGSWGNLEYQNPREFCNLSNGW
jgi:hypothetical protein